MATVSHRLRRRWDEKDDNDDGSDGDNFSQIAMTMRSTTKALATGRRDAVSARMICLTDDDLSWTAVSCIA